MNGSDLFVLGRRLMKVAEDSIRRSGYTDLPTSVRLVLADVLEHPNTAVGEIAARTGFPQSHVSASVARLRAGGALLTSEDSRDRRRTLVRSSPAVRSKIARGLEIPIEEVLTEALGTRDAKALATAADALETLAALFERFPDETQEQPMIETTTGTLARSGPIAADARRRRWRRGQFQLDLRSARRAVHRADLRSARALSQQARGPA